MRPHDQLKSKLEQKVSKLESHLEHFPPDAAHLQVHLQRHSKRVWFTAALTLRLPSNMLRSEKSGEDPVPAFDQAIKAMLREIGGLKSALRRESQWKQLSPIGRLPEIKAPRLARIPAIAGQG